MAPPMMLPRVTGRRLCRRKAWIVGAVAPVKAPWRMPAGT